MHQAAAAFVDRWRGETRERAEKDTFWNEFLNIFGLDRRRAGVFEYVTKRYSTERTGFMDLLVPGQMAVEHKSDMGRPGETDAQRDGRLGAAMDQLIDYMPDLKRRDLPQLLVVCDFHWFRVRDIETGADVTFPLTDLPRHVDDFAFLAGYLRRAPAEPDEIVNLRATDHLGRLYDALMASRYPLHDLRVLLVRLLYVLFADDTAIWTRNLFYDWLIVHTNEDGSDLGARLIELFQVLDTDRTDRQAGLPEHLTDFSYINGGLFKESIKIPHCDREMREHLIDACAFEWNLISPAIFGSLFQGVMDAKQRRELGAHYTSERDILRTIKPLFLDALDERVARAKTYADRNRRLAVLRQIRDELPTLNFFDPACGCGNFLVLCYRELRRVELDCLVAIRKDEASAGTNKTAGFGQDALDVTLESKVTVEQFYGIEIEEFPARIAETAMHLVDHQANLVFSETLGDYYVRLPIADNSHIRVDNALTCDWGSILDADACSYLLGNPPFAGASKRTGIQTEELKAAWGDQYFGYLDFVTAWYVKARHYVDQRSTRVAFVSTSSICQGEAAAALWQPLSSAGFAIDFAHRMFLWRSEAKGPAGVHVVIVGWSRAQTSRGAQKLLYDYVHDKDETPVEVRCDNINAYLAPSPNVFIRRRSRALSPLMPSVGYGSKPVDGGGLLVEAAEYASVASDAIASKYLRPFVGADELINGDERWCLWMEEYDPADLRSSPVLKERIAVVRELRSGSKKVKTLQDALTPHLFQERRQPTVDYLAIPAHVSQARLYYPSKRFSAATINGNHNFHAADPDGFVFAVLSSQLFATWMRGVAGRIRDDLRFSVTFAWNNFPLPALTDATRRALVAAGRDVLDARALHPTSSLADLYDPNAMPVEIVRAHAKLDRVLGAAMAGKRKVDTEPARLALLFGLWSQLDADGQLALTAEKPGRRRSQPR